MKILLTGITGLAGSFIAKKLINENHEIYGLVRQSADMTLLNKFKEKINFIEGDILDVPNLYNAIKGKDVVIHCAAMVSFANKDREKLFKTNVEGTANVVNACIEFEVKKLIYLSSVAAIGKGSQLDIDRNLPLTELTEWYDSKEVSNYAKSKYLAELEVWRGSAENLPVIILNPSVILGEGDWHKSSTRLFKYVFDENRFYTDGLLNYIDVEDLAEITIKFLNSTIANERYIVSTGQLPYIDFFTKTASYFQKKSPKTQLKSIAISILWRLEAVRAKITGNEPLITKETAQSAKKHFKYSNLKLKTELNFQFRTIDQSLERICKSILEKNLD